MKRIGKLDAIFGMIIPWVNLILLVGVASYYCELLLVRSFCIILATLNGFVTLRLAWRVWKEEKQSIRSSSRRMQWSILCPRAVSGKMSVR